MSRAYLHSRLNGTHRLNSYLLSLSTIQFADAFTPIIGVLQSWLTTLLSSASPLPPSLPDAAETVHRSILQLVEKLSTSLPQPTSPAMEGIRSLLDTSRDPEGAIKRPIDGVASTFIDNAFRTLRLSKEPVELLLGRFFVFWREIRSEACLAQYLRRSQEDLLHCIAAMRVGIPAGLREAIHKLQLRGQLGCGSSEGNTWKRCHDVFTEAISPLVQQIYYFSFYGLLSGCLGTCASYGSVRVLVAY